MVVYGSAQQITPGTSVQGRTGFAIAASSPGWVRVIMANGSYFDVYVAAAGTEVWDGYAITGVDAANTTAVCRVTVLGGL